MEREQAAKGPDAAPGPALLRGGQFRPLNVRRNASLSALVPSVHVPCSAVHFPVCPSLPEALVDLMAVVVRLCPSVCESSHLAVLLGAYGASLSVLGEDVAGSVWGQAGGVTRAVSDDRML